MLNFLSENRAPALAVCLLLGFLLLLSAHIRTPDAHSRIETTALWIFSPVVRAGTGLVDGTTGLWGRYVDFRDLQAENQLQKEEISRLRLERQRLEEAGRENRRLRQLLGMEQALTLPAVAARVIGLDLGDPFRTALLDRGAADGISVDDPVVTPDGVVGRVTAVTGSVSKVQLLVDPTSGAAATVARTRVQGMVVGRNVNELEMQYVSTLADVSEDDSVHTSGLDGIYPEGFRIGRVIATASGEGLQRRVVVRTEVDFRTLEEVLVLVQPKPAA